MSDASQPKPPAASRQSVLNRLQNIFGFMVRRGRKNSASKIVPAEPRTKQNRDKEPRALKLPSEIQRFWDWWLHECHDTNDSLRNRQERLTDLDYMRYNDGVINMAIEMYADESVQVDSQTEVIKVSSPNPEVERYIREKFVMWGYDQTALRALAEDIAQYGEAFEINSTISGEGIIDVTHVDPRVIKDRIEFRASDVNIEFISSTGYMTNDITRVARLQALQKVLTEVGSTWSKYFKTFLFGFQLENDIFLPPWNVSHYRNFTTKKEVYPWGRSPFLYSIALFRQLKAAKNLMAVARAMSLPREVFTVAVDGDMTWAERWEMLNEVREEYQNISDISKTKEELTVGSQFWGIKDALEFEWKSSEVNVGDIKDIEVLRDDEIISTRIPKGYLIVDRANFGTSGQALLQQYKPFGRACFNQQSILLRDISNKLRLDMLIAGKFEKEFTEFDLSMNFPVVEEAADRTRAKSDSFHFAVDVINGVKDLLGVEGPLPTDVIRSVLSKLSFLSSEEINDWVIEISKQDVPDPPSEEDAGRLAEGYKKMREVARARLTEDTVRLVEFEALKRAYPMGEYVKNGRHHLMNFKVGRSFIGDAYDRALVLLAKKTLFEGEASRGLMELVSSQDEGLAEVFNSSAELMEKKELRRAKLEERFFESTAPDNEAEGDDA